MEDMKKPTSGIRLEIGAGKAPKKGYIHNDINKFDHIEYVCNAWEIPLPPNSVLEILTDGVVEHLTRLQVDSFFRKAYQLLVPGGILQFNVPDIRQWCIYLYNYHSGGKVPFSADHIFASFWGWQRWPGDEHKWGWTKETICRALSKAGFDKFDVLETSYGAPEDAHLYCKAVKGEKPSVIPAFNLLGESNLTLLHKIISNLSRSFLGRLLRPLLAPLWRKLSQPGYFALYPSPDNCFSVSIKNVQRDK